MGIIALILVGFYFVFFGLIVFLGFYIGYKSDILQNYEEIILDTEVV